MGQKVGHKKYGGRKKGVPNKRTQALMERLDELDLDIPREIFRLLNQLDNLICENPSMYLGVIKSKADIYLELMQYVYPKRKAVEVDPDGNQVPDTVLVKLYKDEENNSA